MRRLLCFLILWTFPLSPVYGEMKHKADFTKTLSGFITEALQNNPQLLEARNRIRMFKEIPPQAGSLKDPKLMFGIMNLPVDTFSFAQEAMTQKQVQVSQEFPFPGKLELKVQAADKDVAIAEQNLKDLELKIVREVKNAFLELCFVKAAMETTQQNKILLEQFITIAETKYSVGKGIQQDVLKAQVEHSKIMDELIELKQKRDAETARLNSLMNRLPQTPLDIPHGLTKTPFDYKVEQLQEMALANRPFLKAIQASIEKFELNKQLAEKEYYPDFNVGLRYGQRENSLTAEHPDFVSGYVSINIPLWFKTKQSKKVAEQTYKIEVAKETFNTAKNQIFKNIKILYDKEIKAEQLLILIRTGIIPQAKQSLESALASYAVDKVDFLTLIDSQVTLLNWEIKYHRELTDYEQNLAALEHVVGQRLF